MSQIVIQPATVPQDQAFPSTVQGLMNLIAANLRLSGIETLTGLIISASEPDAADRDKAWAKQDQSSGRVLGIYTYRGAWTPIPLVLGSGESEPAGPTLGEVFFNTSTGGLRIYNGTKWTSGLVPEGTTADRPTGVPVGFRYFDTDISRELRYTSTGWSTVDGFIGEIRTADATLTDAEILKRNPGWVVYSNLSGKAPFGREEDSEDFDEAQTGGRISVPWKLSGTSSGGGTVSPTVAGVIIDEEAVYSRLGLSALTELEQKEFKILPPYQTVVFIRKSF